MSKIYPRISIIIVTLNSQRTIKECLQYINKQMYPNKIEVLIIDGGSEDNTFDIVKNSGLHYKIIDGGYRDNQEARRTVGINKAKNEICLLLDSDNFMTENNWLIRMVEPLLLDNEIVATQTLRYAAPKNASALNRYFGLLGGADPVAYYLGKDDRLSWAFSRWNLLGEIIEENKKYFKIAFDPNNYPSVGCNGVMFRRSILLKSNWGNPENYFHADVFVDIGKLGYNKFGIVKNQIFHNTAGTPISFLIKRRNYMQLHHQSLHKKRRQLVFNPAKPYEVIKLMLFILFAITLIEPIFESIRGYMKKKDIAWFLHPIITLGMALLYTEATLHRIILENNMIKILIFGSTGFIGKAISNYIKNESTYKIISPTRYECDLYKYKSVKEYIKIKNPDIIINAAYREVNSNVKITKKYLQDNLKINKYILKSVYNTKSIKKIIFIGSGLEYGDDTKPIDELHQLNPKNYYAKTKSIQTIEAIKIAQQHRLPLVIVKPFNLYGPFDQKSVFYYVIKSTLSNEIFSTTKGEQVRDILYIDDFCDLIKKIIEYKGEYKIGEVINVGYGKGIVLKNAIDEIIKQTNYKKKYTIKSYRENEYFYQVANISKAKKIFNWIPNITFNNGVKKTIDWVKSIDV